MLLWSLCCVVYAAEANGPIVYSGYLLDTYSYNLVDAGGLSLDGTDIIRTPWEHTVHCMRDMPCCRTYYLAENRGEGRTNNYRMKLVLDDDGNSKAHALLSNSHRVNNFKVTVRGQHDGNGRVVNATLKECFGKSCDGVCSGSCEDSAHLGTTSAPPQTFSSWVRINFDTRMSAQYSISPNGSNIRFTVILGDYGWLALGSSVDGTLTSNGMGSDFFICSDGQVKRCWVDYGLDFCGGDPVLGAECTQGNVTIMKFSRSTFPESTQQRPMSVVPGFGTPLVWAYGFTRTMSARGASSGSRTVHFAPVYTPQHKLVPAQPIHTKPSHVALGLRVSMDYEVSSDQKDIFFTVQYKGDGWLGLGISPDHTMTGSGSGSDIIICSEERVRRYEVKSEQFIDASEVPGSECVHGPVTSLKFTRSVHALSESQLPISTKPGDRTHFIWAHGQSRRLSYHAANRGSVSVDIIADIRGASTMGSWQPFTFWLHAGLMLLVWGAILPFCAVWAALQRQREQQFQDNSGVSRYYRIAKGTGVLLGLIGFACGVELVHAQKSGRQHFHSPHSILGTAVVLLSILLSTNALFRHGQRHGETTVTQTAPETQNARRSNWSMWRSLRKATGHAVVVAGTVNLVLGILAAKSAGYGSYLGAVCAAAGGAFVASMIAYTFYDVIHRCKVSANTSPVGSSSLA